MSNIVSDFFGAKNFQYSNLEGYGGFIYKQVLYANQVNIDDLTRDCPHLTRCTNIFRESQDECVSSFSTFLGVWASIYIQFMKVIYALKHTQRKDFQILIGE